MTLFILFVSCSKNNSNLNTNSQISGTSEQLVIFPHSSTWQSSHITYMAGTKPAGGEEKCLQCHQGNLGLPRDVNCTIKCHKSVNQPPQPAPLPVPVPNQCTTSCHTSVIQNKYAHYPTNAGLCDSCHLVSAKHIRGEPDPVQTKKTADDCYRCHTRVDTEPVVHGALKDDQSCIACHNPHGGDRQFFIRAANRELCLMCHDQSDGAAIKHGPAVDKTSCFNCHSPHSSTNKNLLILPSKQLCLSCHDKTISATLNDVRIIPNIKAKLEQTTSQHTGVVMGDCTTCHDPHGSLYNRLLTANYSISNYNEYPGKGENPYALCFNCHNTNMLNEKDFIGKTGFRSTNTNYHWSHVVDAAGSQDKTKGRACRICHDAHGSNQDFNINESWDMNGYPINIKYTKTPTGGQCTFTCHDLRIYSRE